LKDMQYMCDDVYHLSTKFYETYEDAVIDIESGSPCFMVWCRFDNPGHLDRSIRHRAVTQLSWHGTSKLVGTENE